jgi:anti-sigma B factor antagonist
LGRDGDSHLCDNHFCLMSEKAATSRIVLDVDRSGDHIVVRCRGMLVAGVNEYLYSEISPLIPGAKKIVLDLTELTHMDSMGLGTVVRLYVSAKSAGCDLKLINLGPRIQKILGVTHLLTVLASIGETGISYL